MSDLKVALTLTADGKQLIGTVNNTQKVVSDLNTKLNQTKGASNNAAQGLTVVDRQSSSAAKSIQYLGHMAVGAFAGISAINLGQKITQDLAAFQDVRTRLQSLSGSTAAYAENEKFLIELTQRHSKELIPLADSYSKLLALQDGGLLTQAQSQQILEGLSNAQSATGATTAQLGQAMYGLQQALASGVVRAEEFNQVTEPMGNLINKLATAAGKSVGDFRKMINAGEVTSDMFRDTLIKALHEYDGAAAATSANINAQTAAMQNAYQQLIVAFETPINSSLTPVLSTITEGLIWATDNADLLQQVFGVAVVTALTRATQAGAVHTASLVKDAYAAAATRMASIAAAEAELQRAKVQRAAVLTSGQAVVAEARLAAAIEAKTIVTKQATLATRAYGAATALVGGPAGLAFMAASGIAYLAYEASSAEKPISGLTSEVDKLNSKLSAMNEAQRGIEVSKLSTKMQEYRDEMADAQSEIDGLIAQGFSGSDTAVMFSVQRIEELQAYIVKLEAKLNDASEAQQKLFKVGMPELANSPGDTDNPSTINKQQQTLLDNLTKQQKLYGDVSEAAKVRYEIEYGSLKNLDPVVNAKILQAAKELDATKAQADATKVAKDQIEEQKNQLKSLLAVLDPVTTAANEMADKERLLKTYFEQANVPLEKRKQLLDALKEQYAEPDSHGKDFNRLQGELDPAHAATQTHNDNLAIIDAEIAQTPEDEVAKLAYLNGLKLRENESFAEKMKEINQGVAFDWDQMWNDSVARMAQGIGAATADALFEAQDFGEATQQVLKGVGKAAVQMLVEWMAQKALAAAFSNTLMAQNAATATTTAAATGASVTASMAPAAATTSIATMGSGAMVGIAALVAAMAMLPSIIGKFHGGGTIPREGTYLLDGGETVYTRKQQQTLMNAMNATASNENSTSSSNKITINLIEDNSRGGEVDQQPGLNGEDVINIFVANVRKGGDAASVLESTYQLQRTGR